MEETHTLIYTCYNKGFDFYAELNTHVYESIICLRENGYQEALAQWGTVAAPNPTVLMDCLRSRWDNVKGIYFVSMKQTGGDRKINGYDVAKAIQGIDPGAAIAIIANYNRPAPKRYRNKFGVLDHIYKGADDCAARVKNFIEQALQT